MTACLALALLLCLSAVVPTAPVAALSALADAPADAPATVRATPGDAFAAALTRLMPDMLAHYRVPGAVVSYIRDGEVTWTMAYGLAGVRSGDSMRPEMLFNHGSNGKVLTAWGVMRLVEQGKVDLDAPVNRYLKRWQVRSDEFDVNEVTVRRLLSHTGGLTVHGFSDYSPRRSLPGLTGMLAGQNQLDGQVVVAWPPGSTFEYSGGGYVLLQMLIEDVSGRPFATFMEREVTRPLGLSSLVWSWPPGANQVSATPHGSQGQDVGYRRLAAQAVGSEVSTVADFARFVAAAVPGANGEPAGRGVLSPQSVAEMLTVQAKTNGTEGLGYGLAQVQGDRLAMHFGANPGWSAHFLLDVNRREGFVVATNSSNGFPFNVAVQNLWLRTVLGGGASADPAPEAPLNPTDWLASGLALLLGLPLLVALVVLGAQVATGRRRWVWPPSPRRLVWVAPWLLVALLWWYWFYAPFPLPFAPSFPDILPSPQLGYVMAVLLAWVAQGVVRACLPAHQLSGHQQPPAL